MLFVSHIFLQSSCWPFRDHRATEEQDGAYLTSVGWPITVINESIPRFPSRQRNTLSTAPLSRQHLLSWCHWLDPHQRGRILSETFLLGGNRNLRVGVGHFTNKGEHGPCSLNHWLVNTFRYNLCRMETPCTQPTTWAQWWPLKANSHMQHAFRVYMSPLATCWGWRRQLILTLVVSQKILSRLFNTGFFVKFWMLLGPIQLLNHMHPFVYLYIMFVISCSNITPIRYPQFHLLYFYPFYLLMVSEIFTDSLDQWLIESCDHNWWEVVLLKSLLCIDHGSHPPHKAKGQYLPWSASAHSSHCED